MNDWLRVFNEYSVEELKFISETIRRKNGRKKGDSTRRQIIDMFRLQKGDNSVSIEDCVDITDDGEGASPEIVKEKLSEALHKIDPVIGSLALCAVREITTNTVMTRDGADGDCESSGYINIKNENTNAESTTIHEFGHAVFFMLNISRFTNEGYVDFREENDGYGKGIPVVPDSHPIELKEMANRLISEWDSFKKTDVREADFVRHYQFRDFNEYLCVAFGTWIDSPEELEEEQPIVYEILEEYLTDMTHREEIDISHGRTGVSIKGD